MKSMIYPPNNKLDFLWPDTYSERGRRLARNVGIFAIICFIGQHFIRLDHLMLQIDSGVPDLEIIRTVYWIILLLLFVLVWRILRWGRISAVIGFIYASMELVLHTVNYVPGANGGLPIWNLFVVTLSWQGVRGTFAYHKEKKDKNSDALVSEEPDKEKMQSKERSLSWWRMQSKQFRAWVFVSFVWALLVLIFVAVFDPFNAGSWGYIDEEGYLQMIVIMCIPLLAGGIMFTYNKVVK